ncbi:MAG: N-acetylmuramoyl-L-alanine amidase [Firmicutes bacterium]|nr:N-acetylmuramoyl-L-alanine amidase [Bacillota bacterium]
MIYSIKRKTIIIIAVILVAVIATIVVTTVAVRAHQTSGFNGKVVVIDAGHGGVDGGVVGRNTGVREADINLAIARLTQRNLEEKGFRVVMTRNSADGLYGLATRNRKLRDMEARRNIINRANPHLIISIHQNSFPSPSVRGPQVFFSYSKKDCESRAVIMQNALNTTLESDRLSKRGDFFILSSTPHPALLVESGFLSNPEEEKLLISPDYQEKVAYAIASGVYMILF